MEFKIYKGLVKRGRRSCKKIYGRRSCKKIYGEGSGPARLVAALGQDSINFILPFFSWCQDHEVTRTSMDESRQAPRNIDT